MFMDKNKVKFWNDVLMFIVFIIIAVSGFILWFVLPRGGGRAGNGFLFLRETWILIHDWFSVILIILVLLHLILNWRWIKAMFKNIFGRRGI